MLGRDRVASTVVFHPGDLAFCRDWDITPRACRPYRARTKGKTESGVKYVKRNGLAGREFASFVALETHLVAWMAEADQRIHGTTHEAPLLCFDREEWQVSTAATIRVSPVKTAHRPRIASPPASPHSCA